MDPDAAPIAPVRFLDLGDLLVESAAGVSGPGGARPAAALATLLVHANRRVAVDVLAAAMWPEGPPRSISTLESHLWRLRRVLEPSRRSGEPPSLLLTEPGGYRLAVSADQVDSVRFAHLVDEAPAAIARGHPEHAVALCERARALWRGRPFAPIADQPWATPAIARLDEYRTQLDERHVEALLAMDRPDRALLELETALGEHPLREHLWAQRMLAAFRAGRVDDALAAYRRARALLREELGTEPSDELATLHRRVLARDPTLHLDRRHPVPSGHAVDGLPRWADRLVGRDQELRRLTALVTGAPLVTVTGPAGVGKTRLAVEAARRAAPTFPDAAWFVDLSGVSDGDQVVDAVTTALGLAATPAGSSRADVRTYVRDRRMLLVLDDCEHVVAAVADLVDVLGRAAPGLVVLAASRVPLANPTETVVELTPLALPEAGGRDSPAVDLLLDRLGTTTPTADAVRICRAVEGVPLAIELAAGRARTFALAEVAEHTEQDPSALGALGHRRRGPHAGLRTVVDRSYRHLDGDEQLLHRRLAVLPGPFTVRAAAAVGDLAPASAADVLADLVHRSLLVAHGPSRPGRASRFAQLSIIRAHAARALDDVRDVAAGRDRRDAWLHGTVTRDRPRLGTPAEQAWSDALDDDLPTLRATLQRTLVEKPSPAGAEIVGALGMQFWYQHDAILEGTRWTELAHAASTGEGPAPVDRILVTVALATARAFAGRGDLAAPLCEQALDALGRTPTDPAREPAVGDALIVLSTCLWLAGERDPARRALDVPSAVAERTGDPGLELLVRIRSGMDRLGVGPASAVLPDAIVAHQDAAVLDNSFAAFLAAALAQLAAVAAGDPGTALAWSDTCLAAIDRTGRRQAPLQLELRANILAMLGRHEEALRLYDAARAHHGRAGVPWPGLGGTAELLEGTRAAVPRHAVDPILRDAGRLGVRELLATIDR